MGCFNSSGKEELIACSTSKISISVEGALKEKRFIPSIALAILMIFLISSVIRILFGISGIPSTQPQGRKIFLSADRVFCDYEYYSAQQSGLSRFNAHELWNDFRFSPV